MLKRLFDLSICLTLSIIFAPLIIFIAIMIKLDDGGKVLYYSDRVGIYNSIFKMPKFRTMKEGTPVVATHLLTQTDSHLTKLGSFLRRTSLDELPQLLSVIKGDMSLVGPRPALYNQDDLIELRTKSNVHKIPPGITGWAQINGRDEIAIPEKVKLDAFYYDNRSFIFDIKILFLTAFKVFLGSDVSH